MSVSRRRFVPAAFFTLRKWLGNVTTLNADEQADAICHPTDAGSKGSNARSFAINRPSFSGPVHFGELVEILSAEQTANQNEHPHKFLRHTGPKSQKGKTPRQNNT